MALSDLAATKTAWRKAEIMDLLKGFSRETVRNIINETISEVLNIPIEEAKKNKSIRPSVVKVILSKFE